MGDVVDLDNFRRRGKPGVVIPAHGTTNIARGEFVIGGHPPPCPLSRPVPFGMSIPACTCGWRIPPVG